MTDKLDSFPVADRSLAVQFAETMVVKEGVECDVYRFLDDDTRDLAIVRVVPGAKTPLQKVLKGTSTIEGYVDGAGSLTVIREDGTHWQYHFDPEHPAAPVSVAIGDVMQWHADGDANLTFFEVCEPPYQDGRFENLPE